MPPTVAYTHNLCNIFQILQKMQTSTLIQTQMCRRLNYFFKCSIHHMESSKMLLTSRENVIYAYHFHIAIHGCLLESQRIPDNCRTSACLDKLHISSSPTALDFWAFSFNCFSFAYKAPRISRAAIFARFHVLIGRKVLLPRRLEVFVIRLKG